MKLTQANELYRSVMEQFLIEEETSCFRELAPARDGDRKSCFLWSYFATSGMLYFACKAGADTIDQYRRVIDNLCYYRSKPQDGSQIKYHSERGSSPGGGHGPCFFDDNIWVARNFLFAYEIFGEEPYLEETCRIVNYIYTGWNSELGGLVWNENGLTENGTEQELERGLSANACCIIVNAILYRLTKDESYLKWALRFYSFCKQTQDEDTKIYYNGIHTIIENGTRRAGEVNRDLYGYNSGSMIMADILLFEITGNQDYITDARESAEAAYRAFIRFDSATLPRYYKDFIWFTAVLAESYTALSPYSAGKSARYMKDLEQSLLYSLNHHKAPNGLLPHDYISGWRNNDDYDRMLLTHSATAEIAFLLISSSGVDLQV